MLLPKDALRAALVPDAEIAVTDRSDASGTSWSMRPIALASSPVKQRPV